MRNIVYIFICLTATLCIAAQEQPPVISPSGRVDPSTNVMDLVNAANRRQDDLRNAEASHIREIMALRAEQDKESRKYESGRLDSIRQVDREEVNKRAADANVAIATLAEQTRGLSTTLAKQVTEAATATEVRFSAFQNDTNKRLSSLETAASERIGKQQVSDPQLDRNNALLEKLASAQAANVGKSEGVSNLYTLVVAGGLFLIAVYTAFRSRQNGKAIRTRNGHA